MRLTEGKMKLLTLTGVILLMAATAPFGAHAEDSYSRAGYYVGGGLNFGFDDFDPAEAYARDFDLGGGG